MANKLLRKIILEELRKVLEEEEAAEAVPEPSQMDLLYKYLLNKATASCSESSDFGACMRERGIFKMRITSVRPYQQSIIDFSKDLYKSNKHTSTEDIASLGTVLTKLKDVLSDR